MRLGSIAFLASLFAGLTACAGSPPVRTASAAPVVPPAAVASAAPMDRQVKVDATNIEDVQRAGYKIVDENGKKLYCRRDLNTGSHLRKTTTCLTEAELIETLERTRRGVEEMSRRQMPPPSN